MPTRIPTFRPQFIPSQFKPADAPDRFYDQSRWRRLSKIVLREEPICSICGQRLSQQVDHIVPIKNGGEQFHRKNLRGICIPFHNKVRKQQREV